MTKLVINADDFGYSRAINFGIVDAHVDGVVTSTTMMANMPGLSHAAELHQTFPHLGIGVHLALTVGKPILENVSTLVDETGNFHSLNVYKTDELIINPEELYSEWHAQITRLIKMGISLTHIDSHHYTHAFSQHLAVAEELSNVFQLPLRNCLDAKKRTQNEICYPTDDFWNLFNFPEMKDMSVPYQEHKKSLFSQFQEDARFYQQYNAVEASCHPGYLDEEVWYGSSFNLARMKEMAVLKDKDFAKMLATFGYDLVTYKELV